jgi:hypothetical protein
MPVGIPGFISAGGHTRLLSFARGRFTIVLSRQDRRFHIVRFQAFHRRGGIAVAMAVDSSEFRTRTSEH